jgi:two-component system response regulator DevR
VGSKAKVFALCCNRLLRESIARILSKKTDLEIIASQAPGSASREEILASGTDILVLDSMQFLFGNPKPPPALPVLSRSLACVLVAMENDHNRFLTAIRGGVRGYVLQDASAADVVAAIRTVADGQVVCPPEYTQVLFDFVATQTEELPNSQRRAKWGLTRREQQLIPLIGRGLSNKEIANYLSLSEQTVKNHIHRILRKVGVSSRLSAFEVCQNQASSFGTKSSGYST